MSDDRAVIDAVRPSIRELTNDRNPASGRKVGFYGLDLYSLFTSIHAVIQYLDKVDPEAARRAAATSTCSISSERRISICRCAATRARRRWTSSGWSAPSA